MEKKPHILILGAGPAGLGAAYQLTHKRLASVTVVEASESVGGIAASFEISGLRVDYGSHRLHRACDPQILNDIRSLLGDDLLDRPRHGRIRLNDRWLHFPLKPLDLLSKLPLSFAVGAAFDMVQRNFHDKPQGPGTETFKSIMAAGLGRTICRKFYFPYAQKIWGVPPEELSHIQARRRVSSNSTKQILVKILSQLPGLNSSKNGRFFYPRRGFGQICEHYYRAAKDTGAEFHLGTQPKTILLKGQIVSSVHCIGSGNILIDRPDYVWSTIPIPSLVRLFDPPVPHSVRQTLDKIQYRAVILVYLLLEQARFSEYDAHYFPSMDIPITRLSEPKNYSDAREPSNRTVLCAEIPCSANDPKWSMSDRELGELVFACLEKVGIPVQAPIIEVVTRRLSHAYPIYRQGYERYFNHIDGWLKQVRNLLSFGRQGLFAHDNIHHALCMAYRAVACLDKNGRFDQEQWQQYRGEFETHVVED